MRTPPISNVYPYLLAGLPAVALKTFQRSRPNLADIFRAEVAHWIALENHPNIVRCYYMQIYDNIPFLVMEWVAGREDKSSDLRSWLQHGPLDLTLTLKFTVDIVRGIQHANQKVPGIVHRDLKPDNVLVNRSRQAKITDFGLAKVIDDANLAVQLMENGENIPHYSNMGGTFWYMAPEQWLGHPLDFRTDVYAIGCILYELLTGHPPYEGRTVSELRSQHLESPLPILKDTISTDIQHILDGCLAKHREDRFERIGVLLNELEQLYRAHSGNRLAEVSAGEFTASDYNNRGLTFGNLGQEQRAIEDFDQALRLDPDDAPTYYNRGLCYNKLRQEQRAIEDFDQALRLDPNDAPTYYERGLSYANLGQEARAIEDFDQALRLDPNDAKAYKARGTSFSHLGQEEQAVADYDEALRLNHDDPETYLNQGFSYSRLGQHQRAITDFDWVLRLDSNNAIAYANRGEGYAYLGQHQRAIEDFDQALRLDPSNTKAYMGRGTSYLRLGREARAIEDFDQTLRLDPNFVNAYVNRGTSYISLGQHQRAIEDFDQALHLDPNHAHAYVNRGAIYSSLGQHQRAIEDFDQALRLDPNDAKAWYNKGVMLINMDRLHEALPYLEKAYALGNHRVIGVIQQVRQELNLPLMQIQANPNDQQAAFAAFQQTHSLDAMWHTLMQFPLLSQMIPAIEQVIEHEVPPKHKPPLKQRLAWLRQIVTAK